MGVGRKPVHLEMVGNKSNRQRIWEAVRAEAQSFTAQHIAWAVDLDLETTRYYLNSLKRGGYIEVDTERFNQGRIQFMRLVKDCGVEAPSITRKGEPNRMGLGTEAMWRTLRILGEVSAEELAAQASVSTPTTTKTAYSYLRDLVLAGYVLVVDGGKAGPKGRPAKYRLAPGKYTGPQPPMIQRDGNVFDPNLGQVVFQNAPVVLEERP